MQRICPRLDANVDDGTWLPTVIRLWAGLNVKLLNRVDRQVGGGSPLNPFSVNDRHSIVGIVIVDPVDNKVIVLRPVAIRRDRFESAAGSSLNAGLQDGEVLEVAPQER